ncbi:cell division protein ZapE [Phreatobacter stygius]|uniref:Cell division protein ZapE n=1 Tax=Phreatobacter stygius TaxID=1940610 RepID=A0A4D7BDW0_9HYPH|nr:cell division protein ZapE [Phreatobacter stygius]QCI66127.1 cell division protein ZapE [Phreatobacter stygius]
MADTLSRYHALVEAGEISFDAAQAAVAKRLNRLNEELADFRLSRRKSSALAWLFSRGEKREPVTGLYIWGEVGRGKTMLMDLFMAASPVRRKRRAHFHEFMADVHERIHAYRQKLKSGEVKGDDPIAPVAMELAEEAWLLCFDEFSVTDIADAMILGRLFTKLFEEGVVVVATSNVVPDQLYKDGLNRALFLPFIKLLQERMAVVKLESRTDFRLEKLAGRPVWTVPLGAGGDQAMDEAWARLTGGAEGEPSELIVKGRHVAVPRQARGLARFSFAELCERPLGASDYLAIAHAYHTVLIDRIPVMRGLGMRNEAKRFITLIDALYDNSVKLVASAGAEPTGLYLSDEGVEVFEFNRTASRLIEMRSEDYLAAPHERRVEPSADTGGIVET